MEQVDLTGWVLVTQQAQIRGFIQGVLTAVSMFVCYFFFKG